MTATTYEELFFAKSAPLTVQGQPAGSLRAALLPVGYSQGLGGGSYSFLLSFRARAFFIPLTFLNALLIPHGRVYTCVSLPVYREPRRGSPTSTFIAALPNFSRANSIDDGVDTLLREFNVGNDRRESGRAESERLSPHPDRLSDPSYTVCLPSPPLSPCSERARTLRLFLRPSSSSSSYTTRRSRGFPSSAGERDPVSFSCGFPAHGCRIAVCSSLLLLFFLLLLLLSLSVFVCLSLSSLSFSLPRLPFRLFVSFLFCVL